MVVDGANKALNRLVHYLQGRGAAVRIYSPTVAHPAFEAQAEIVNLPSVPIPGRMEYRVPLMLSARVREDLERFAPTVLHVSSPDFAARAAARWARARNIPVLASVHTRFETYASYYRLGFLKGIIESLLRRLYSRCNALVAPSAGMVDLLRARQMNDDISLWQRGVDRSIFNSGHRDPSWRRKNGIGDADVVIGFFGRLVLEKGLDDFAKTIAELRRRNVPHKVVVVGDGPARGWFERRLSGAVLTGFLQGDGLGRAVSSIDVLFNPSVTETFGNVTLEAMACGIPVVVAQATGSANLIKHGLNGAVVRPGNIAAYADALEAYVTDASLRYAHGKAAEECSHSYDWDVINQAMAESYLRLVGRNVARHVLAE
jgi:glycosyltransferase involved in cell wall biosynthesis